MSQSMRHLSLFPPPPLSRSVYAELLMEEEAAVVGKRSLFVSGSMRSVSLLLSRPCSRYLSLSLSLSLVRAFSLSLSLSLSRSRSLSPSFSLSLLAHVHPHAHRNRNSKAFFPSCGNPVSLQWPVSNNTTKWARQETRQQRGNNREAKGCLYCLVAYGDPFLTPISNNPPPPLINDFR